MWTNRHRLAPSRLVIVSAKLDHPIGTRIAGRKWSAPDDPFTFVFL
jgi:hypothetical protein